ncbi:glycosyl transferase [Longispora fulva]|nr:glycosyl transferase [Longispora fulva]
MKAVATAEDGTVAPGARPRGLRALRPWAARHRFGLFAGLVYTLGGFWVYARLWVNPQVRLVGDGQDHQLFIWMLGHAARAVTHLENPLFSTRLNAPDGVSMMANTSVLGLGIPMTPVTVLFGATVSFAVLGVLSLAGTAAAWYYVFSRHLVTSKPAAAVAGALCGFAPGQISHSPGHLHIIAQFVLPFIVLYVLKLAKPGRTVRDGVILGLLITYQAFISEEMLLLTAIGCGGLALVYAVLQRREARAAFLPLLRGLSVAALVAGVLLAYPIWLQFFGRQYSRGLPFHAGNYITNTLAYVTYPGQSIAGDQLHAVHLASNYGEENAFFGWPLMLLSLAIVIWLWKTPMVRLIAFTALGFAILSLGKQMIIGSHNTRIPLPFWVLEKLPVLDMALPTRFSLIVVPLIAALLAVAGDRISRASDGGLPVKGLFATVMAMALIPIVPIPLHGFDPRPVPEFITSGQWKAYVPEGRTLVPVPLPRNDAMDGMRWAAAADVGFAVPRGFSIVPDGTDKRSGVFDAPPRHTSDLLRGIASTGHAAVVTDNDRREAVADLRYWKASVVVLGEQRYQAELRGTLDALLGPGQLIGGAWVWDVRSMVS